MESGLTFLWLSILLSASSGADAVDFNPLTKINDQVASLGQHVKNAPEHVKQQLARNTVERTFTDYYSGGHKFATVVTDNDTDEVIDCMLIGDREFIAYMVGDKSVEWSGPLMEFADDAPNIPIINTTTDRIDDFIARCDNTESSNATQPVLQKFLSSLKNGPRIILKYAAIFPGTKWCGAGDVARNYDDLGRMAETDKCCRDHDHAIESIGKGKEKYGLKNNLLYTMTKCADDVRFNKCLYDTGTVHSGAVGTTYFNVLKTKCFDKRKQARCARRLVSLLTPCKEYVYDEKSPETWQIFDASQFVPNASLPMQKINEVLHSAPGLGDFLALL